jgi:hypothetical protein
MCGIARASVKSLRVTDALEHEAVKGVIGEALRREISHEVFHAMDGPVVVHPVPELGEKR